MTPFYQDFSVWYTNSHTLISLQLYLLLQNIPPVLLSSRDEEEVSNMDFSILIWCTQEGNTS